MKSRRSLPLVVRRAASQMGEGVVRISTFNRRAWLNQWHDRTSHAQLQRACTADSVTARIWGMSLRAPDVGGACCAQRWRWLRNACRRFCRTADAHAAAEAETLNSSSSTLASLASSALHKADTASSTGSQGLSGGSSGGSQSIWEGDLATLRVCTCRNGSRWLLGSCTTGQVRGKQRLQAVWDTVNPAARLLTALPVDVVAAD